MKLVYKFIKKHGKSGLFGIVVGFINGLLGSGGGSLLVPVLERVFHVKEHKAHATAIGVILPLSIISSIVYIQSDTIDFGSLLYVALGGVIGGLIGARLLGKVPAIWLHRIFGCVMIVAAIRMIFS